MAQKVPQHVIYFAAKRKDITHYRAGDTTSGAADEPHLARDVTY